ncbi:uncharacterized protein METZ01_LOCUS144735 [marine metagenome]|uniref:Uncharacterized protein n=1 Tax=marine metagenome TaxID=408172 RepID=A0A381ZSE2_9ZZZZ
MAFYWDVYPDLLLVVICDDCAAKEEFVHVQEPGEDAVSDSASGADSVPEWFSGAFDDSEN